MRKVREPTLRDRLGPVVDEPPLWGEEPPLRDRVGEVVDEPALWDPPAPLGARGRAGTEAGEESQHSAGYTHVAHTAEATAWAGRAAHLGHAAHLSHALPFVGAVTGAASAGLNLGLAVNDFKAEGAHSDEGYNHLGGAALGGAGAALSYTPYGAGLAAGEIGADVAGAGAKWGFGEKAGFNAETIAGGMIRGTVGDRSTGWKVGSAVSDALGGGWGGKIAGAGAGIVAEAGMWKSDLSRAAGAGIVNEAGAIASGIWNGEGVVGGGLHTAGAGIARGASTAWQGVSQGAHDVRSAWRGELPDQQAGGSDLIDGVGHGLDKARSGIESGVGQGLRGIGRGGLEIGRGVADLHTRAVNAAGNAIVHQGQNIVHAHSDLVGGAFQGLADVNAGIGDGIVTAGQGIGRGASDAWDAWKGRAPGQKPGGSDIVDGVGHGLHEAASGVVGGVGQGIAGLGRGIGSAASGVLRAAGDFYDGW